MTAVLALVLLVAIRWEVGDAPRAMASAEAVALDRSIAVLPFANLSADPENVYFSDGITEEIRSLLAQVPELQVVARSSSLAFKDQNLDVREVGRKLNVVTVLEGSVRKTGDRVRINAQLVHVESGYQLWSESYDRRVEDAFKVQDEIARSIADVLRLKLVGQEHSPIGMRAPPDPQAYELYLKGRHYVHERTPQSTERGMQYLHEALARDSSFAAAKAALATGYAFLGYHGWAPPDSVMARAETIAREALASDPSLAEARLALAHVDYYRSLHEEQRIARPGSVGSRLRMDTLR